MLQPDNNTYDVVIVGAGPSGLSAARTVARLGYKTAVVEKLAGPGELGHACNAIVLPIPDLVPSEHALGGLFFPQVDLFVPGSLIITEQAQQRFYAPGGNEFVAGADEQDASAALIDKPGLLRLLAEQARAAGAHFMWNTSATALLFEGERVCGVRTDGGDLRAELVIAAEGASRHLCEGAHLYNSATSPARQMLVLTQELDAPAVSAGRLGRVVTLGRHGSALAGFGSVLMAAPGRAVMTYSMILDEVDCGSAATRWQHLAEFARDPRIAGLLKDARVLQRSSFLMPLDEAPGSTVRDGFIGVGDAVTPAGYLGILPAMYLGRQAGLVATGALDMGDTSAAALMEYDDFFRILVLPGLQAEARSVQVLLDMSDAELDRLCVLLNHLRLPMPFFQGRAGVGPETLTWLAGQLALDEADLALVGRVLIPATAPAESLPGWLAVPKTVGAALA